MLEPKLDRSFLLFRGQAFEWVHLNAFGGLVPFGRSARQRLGGLDRKGASREIVWGVQVEALERIYEQKKAMVRAAFSPPPL